MERRRQNIGAVSIKRRYGAMSAGEVLHEKQCLLAVAVLLLVSMDEGDEQEEEDMHFIAAMVAWSVEENRRDLTSIVSVRGADVVIDGIREQDAWVDYRFRKEELRRLFNVLGFPRVWVCQNRSRFPGETALLLLLRRLRFPGRLWDLEREFGREYTQLGRLFAEVIDFIWDNHIHRINDYLGYWEPLFESMAGIVAQKGGVSCEGSDIFAFLDGTLRRSCRQQGHDDLQRENFDGHHRAHGLAFQSAVLPNGMIADMWGPAPGRRHDSYLLRQSELNPKLAALQQGKPFQGKVYGDAAYAILSHIDRGFRGANLTAAQRAYNTELSRVRISVEWQFGKIVQIFPFVDFKRNLKLLLSPIGKYYTVAALLTNAHTTCYGCTTSSYFGLEPPSLEEYFTLQGVAAVGED